MRSIFVAVLVPSLPTLGNLAGLRTSDAGAEFRAARKPITE